MATHLIVKIKRAKENEKERGKNRSRNFHSKRERKEKEKRERVSEERGRRTNTKRLMNELIFTKKGSIAWRKRYFCTCYAIFLLNLWDKFIFQFRLAFLFFFFRRDRTCEEEKIFPFLLSFFFSSSFSLLRF